jgi:hypothetical protein
MSQWEWDRFAQVNPKREGESITDWMARLLALADGRRAPVEAARLPYREPGEDA